MARALRMPKVRNPLNKPPAQAPDPVDDVFVEMTLAEHLDELRARIVRICVAIGVCFIFGVILATPMLHLVRDMASVQQFDINEATENITDFFKVALYIAVAMAFPVIFYQIFAFIAPGLTHKERRIVFGSLPFVIVLFLSGASFAFFFAVPRAFKFLSTFQSDVFQFSPTFGSTAAFFIQVSLGMGLAFEAPVVMFLLARLGIVKATRMSSVRRYAAVVVMILSALITPTPDPVNMIIVALPIYGIYEMGLIFARIGQRRHERQKPEDDGEAAAA